MNIDDIARTMLAVEIMLDYSTSFFIMTCDAFSKHSNERVERYLLGVTVDGVDQVRRGDDINFATQHVQSVDGKLALCTAWMSKLSVKYFLQEKQLTLSSHST